MRKASSNGVRAAADDRLAQREDVLPDAFLAPLRLDELEAGVAQVVDQARVGEAAVALEVGHLRHDVGDRDVAHRHQVERVPDAGHVVGQAFVHPQRDAALDQAARDDVELEDVGELVGDQPIELIGRLVDRQHHAIAGRLGEGGDAFRHFRRDDVLLLELGLGLEEDQRHLGAEVVLQLGADVLIGALGVAGDALEVLLDLRVVVDLEVIRRVDVPLEVVVADPVLPEIRNERRLRRELGGVQHGEHHGCGRQQGAAAPEELKHRRTPLQMQVMRTRRGWRGYAGPWSARSLLDPTRARKRHA